MELRVSLCLLLADHGGHQLVDAVQHVVELRGEDAHLVPGADFNPIGQGAGLPQLLHVLGELFNGLYDIVGEDKGEGRHHQDEQNRQRGDEAGVLYCTRSCWSGVTMTVRHRGFRTVLSTIWYSTPLSFSL